MVSYEATYWRDTGTLEVHVGDEQVFEVPCEDHQIGDILEQKYGENASAIPLDMWDSPEAWRIGNHIASD